MFKIGGILKHVKILLLKLPYKRILLERYIFHVFYILFFIEG